jgi:hypothetical protein
VFDLREHEYVFPIIATMYRPRKVVVKNKVRHAKHANKATSASEQIGSDFKGVADRKRKRIASDEEAL